MENKKTVDETKNNRLNEDIYDDEWYAQLTMLREDYDNRGAEIEAHKETIRRLITLLIQNNIRIPEDIAYSYIVDTDIPFY